MNSSLQQKWKAVQSSKQADNPRESTGEQMANTMVNRPSGASRLQSEVVTSNQNLSNSNRLSMGGGQDQAAGASN